MGLWINIWRWIFKRKKNGKGKEYNNYGELIFESEYLNGQKNGKGKEYDVYGKIIFEGEYLNGKKWNGYAQIRERKKGRLGSTSGIEIRYEEGIKLNGKVKEYDINGNLIHERECLKGIIIFK